MIGRNLLRALSPCPLEPYAAKSVLRDVGFKWKSLVGSGRVVSTKSRQFDSCQPLISLPSRSELPRVVEVPIAAVVSFGEQLEFEKLISALCSHHILHSSGDLQSGERAEAPSQDEVSPGQLTGLA